MKTLFSLILCSLFVSTIMGQVKETHEPKPDPGKKLQVVEAACGQCRFDLPGKTCDLAVRINGRSYFVDGTGIDSHGDAHAKDGFCETIRTAEVQGEFINNRFRSTYFKLVSQPVEKQKQ